MRAGLDPHQELRNIAAAVVYRDLTPRMRERPLDLSTELVQAAIARPALSASRPLRPISAANI